VCDNYSLVGWLFDRSIIDYPQHGCGVNITDHDCWSALHHACFSGHLGCVQLILSAGALVHLADKVRLLLTLSPKGIYKRLLKDVS